VSLCSEDKLTCSGNGVGNVVLGRSSLFVGETDFPPVNILCQLAEVFHDGILRVQHVRTWCREFVSGGKDIMMAIAPVGSPCQGWMCIQHDVCTPNYLLSYIHCFHLKDQSCTLFYT
jgi:hypothetical protein